MKYRISHKTRDEVFEYGSLKEMKASGDIGELHHLVFSSMERLKEESYDGVFNYYEIFPDD